MSTNDIQALSDSLIALSAKVQSAQTGGDTAFVLVSAFLVFFMTPGLGFFYSGMTRSKNALSLILLCFLCMSIVMLQWLAFGFSLSFSTISSEDPGRGRFIGDGMFAGLRGVGMDPLPYAPTIPGLAFCIFQMMFACITPALIIGSSAERVRLIPTLIFVFIWTTVVYDPMAYWVWGSAGWLAQSTNFNGSKVLDFAGGTPVHIASGFAGLAFAIVLGKRQGFGSEAYKPSSIANVLLGTAMLWFGWFGFNAGSELASNGRAALAAMTTTISAAAGGLVWVILDYRRHKKLSALGFCSGAVAGLVGITPSAGYVYVGSAAAIGAITSFVCNYAILLKVRLRFDDALDAFGVHGVGGFIGCLLTAIFADNTIAKMDGSSWEGGWMNGNYKQLYIQLAGACIGAGWSFILSYLLLKVMDLIPFLTLRVHPEKEALGTDHAYCGELAYDFSEQIQAHIRAASFAWSNNDGDAKKLIEMLSAQQQSQEKKKGNSVDLAGITTQVPTVPAPSADERRDLGAVYPLP